MFVGTFVINPAMARQGENFRIFQGMTPTAKIKIAIAIPIFIKNWDLDRHDKKFADPIPILAARSRDLLSDLLLLEIWYNMLQQLTQIALYLIQYRKKESLRTTISL